MGSIDFDPSSDPVQQVLVKATSVPSAEQNPLQMPWKKNVFVAAKGAVRNTRIWFNKTLNEYRNNNIDSFIFYSSASEILRASPAVWDYPVCIPFKRVKQLRATGKGFESVSPSSWNFIVFGPPHDISLSSIDKSALFYDKFRDIGRVIDNEYAGDSWSRDLEYYESHRGRL